MKENPLASTHSVWSIDYAFAADCADIARAEYERAQRRRCHFPGCGDVCTYAGVWCREHREEFVGS